MWPFRNNSNNKIFSKIGYYSDQNGIMNRYIREAEQWKTHLENTKAAILKAAENKRKNKVAILGSGWLLDVPAEQLSGIFKEVWLFDVKHPVQIKRKMAKYENIKFVETDISGFAKTIYLHVNNSKSNFSISNLHPQFDFNLNDFDMVVSCNILNQLDIILVDYIKKSVKLTHDTELQIRKLIQNTHLERLPKHKSCLISDIEELSIDKQNNIVDKKSLIYTDSLSKNPINQWIWHFDNNLTYNTRRNTWFTVIATDL